MTMPAGAAVAAAPRLVDLEQVIATFDFAADDDVEKLSFVKGDIIAILDESELEFGWLHGQLGSRRGWFPANRVERIKRKQLLVALYELKATQPGYLSFGVGDVITLVTPPATPDAAWYDGELNGVVGKVPSNYVKLVAQSFDDPTRRQTLQQLVLPPSALLPSGAAATSSGSLSAAAAGAASSTSSGTAATTSTRKSLLSPRTGREYNASYLPSTPFLRVAILRARRLPRVSVGGAIDGGVASSNAAVTASATTNVVPSAYVDVVLGSHHGATHTVQRTGTPEWNVEFLIPLAGNSLLCSALKISVWHFDVGGSSGADANNNDDESGANANSNVNDDSSIDARRRASFGDSSDHRYADQQHHSIFIGELLLPVSYVREHRRRSAWYTTAKPDNRAIFWLGDILTTNSFCRYPLQPNANRGDVRLKILYNSDDRSMNVRPTNCCSVCAANNE